ncbi:MAG: hypothetical protein FWF67_05545 [Fibromonadales bacterium]|nr:hypothetical protein [Fibromonadales bacterium]
MLPKDALKKLNDFLNTHEVPRLTETQLKATKVAPEKRLRNAGGYAQLKAFLKNKQEFKKNLTDAFEAFDNKKGKKHKTSEVYKKACISKAVFYKMLNQLPAKDTVILIAFALEVTIQKAEELLKNVGYSLRYCDHRDLIIRFCFENEITDILEINEVLKQEKERPLLKDKRNKPQINNLQTLPKC